MKKLILLFLLLGNLTQAQSMLEFTEQEIKQQIINIHGSNIEGYGEYTINNLKYIVYDIYNTNFADNITLIYVIDNKVCCKYIMQANISHFERSYNAFKDDMVQLNQYSFKEKDIIWTFSFDENHTVYNLSSSKNLKL